VIGLQTALECVQRNPYRPVVLRAPYPPSDPRTCSVGAGGLWIPFHVHGEHVDTWALQTLDAWLALAKQEPSLVEIVPAVMLLQQHRGPILEDYIAQHDADVGTMNHPQDGTSIGISARLPGWANDPRLHFQHLTVEMLSWQNAVHQLRLPDETTLKQAGYLHAWLFHPPVVDPPNLLQYMLQQLEKSADVDVQTDHFLSSTDELCEYARSLDCTSVINCTGLGSRTICHDDQLVGARGILTHYDRTNCPRVASVGNNSNTKDAVILVDEGPWGSDTMPAYLIPRGDTIVVGGSCLAGDDETGIRTEERERLQLNAQRLGIDTTKTQPVGEWTGFRPVRSSIRCEVDEALMSKHSLAKVIHNYGHGGAGWTLAVGAAKHAVDLLEQ
jgi:D-amino-acid oxidase